MQNNPIRTAYHCEIELLSPVHIGNGDKYVENFDFFYEPSQKKVFVFDRNRLLNQVASSGENTIEAFFHAVEDETLGSWLKGKPDGIRIDKTLLHRFRCERSPRDILVQLRTGTGEPLIAGSSLKGALRTAVLARLSIEEKRQSVLRAIRNLQKQARPNLKFADSRISAELLGRDAQKNLLRSLTVSDFSFDKDSIQLQRVLLTRMTGQSNMKVKFPVLVEKISETSHANGQISFDEFLSKHGREKLGFRAHLSLPWLVEAIRMKTERTLATELNFLQKVHGKYVADLTEFYRHLRDRVDSLNEHEVVLQLAWGSGWKGMTGELLSQEELTDNVRSKLQLAPKYLNFPFPKSRRIAVTDEGAVPLGWVKLTFTTKEEIRHQELARAEQARQDAIKRQKQQDAQAKAKQKWRQMSEVEQFVAIVQGESIARTQAPGKESLRDVWPKLDSLDADGQKEVARAFFEVWSREEKLWMKKHCTESQWKKVTRLVDLLGIDHPDIRRMDSEEQAVLDRISGLKDWAAFVSSGVKIEGLPLAAAEQLENNFREWGCDNKKAKKNKQKAWKKLKTYLHSMRKKK